MDLRNWEFYIDNGNPVVGASVYVREATLSHPNLGSVLLSTTTDSNGMWAFVNLTNTPKDIQVVWGNVSQYQKWYKGLTEHNVYSILTGDGDVVRRKNRLINGAFPLWTRSTSGGTSDNAYMADKWRLLAETTGTGVTQSREASDTPPGGSHYAAKLTVGASNNTKSGLFQIIEGIDIWDLRGSVASFQIQAKVSDPRIGDVRMVIVQWTGTEDNGGTAFPDPINVWGAAGTIPTYTGSWANASTPISVAPTTSWARYTFENIPISASATNLAVFVWIEDKTTTAGDYLLVTDAQLEKGAYASTFERRSIQAELADAQRTALLISQGSAAIFGNGVATSTSAVRCVIPLPVQMRVNPGAIAATGSWLFAADSNVAINTPTFNASSNTLLEVLATATSGTPFTVGRGGTLIGTTGASILISGSDL